VAAAVIGGMINGIVAATAKARVRELEIRERIAMIERGLVPSPETDPKGFEQRMQTLRGFMTIHRRIAFEPAASSSSPSASAS
jgi:hypothetical protein